MSRFTGLALFVCSSVTLFAQEGGKEQRAQADALFAKGQYAQAYSAYEILLGNDQQDFDLNFRYGVCALHAGADKGAAIAYLKRSTQGPAPDARSWYWLGKAYHLTYRFKEALVAYERFRGTADKKALAQYPVDAMELQCRNGQQLLSNLKDIDVHNKVEVDGSDFFRFYDLSSIGGRIVVTPEELKSTMDKKSSERALIYLPDKGGRIYFASYGKSPGTGRDIYRTELLPNGEFATPTKLAGYINTVEDEDFPFMAPDGKSFYFCSKGHNSMGGYDVFKSIYDAGLDAFGPPVNMDFAVNTPDDDVLYLTDPEGKEACFASGRDSKQGMLHVYRVSTAQSPVNITVLKGSFASQFDEKDRKAHIVVLDMLTQEQVADVSTDIDGDYVLSLPRSGRYKFTVEAGPGGKTHVGMVDIPRNSAPSAYRQEMTLVDQGGEKLMIKNYFDQPLDEDMIALALDEILRRARLDVGSRAPVAEVREPAQPAGDAITRAGFAGDITKAGALELAQGDAEELGRAEGALKERSAAAYGIAIENAAIAEAATRRAESLVADADKAQDETARNDKMMQAARERQFARMANQRATAAYQTGQELETERMSTALKAQQATKLHTDLTALLAGPDNDATVVKLVELRERINAKNAPDGTISSAERLRRAATERDREATTLMQRANTARADENELADRVNRKKAEEAAAKGGRRQSLARERAQLEDQLTALREENEAAFARARVAERSTNTARGMAELAKKLAAEDTPQIASELSNDEVARLGQRIASIDGRADALALDARFDAAIAEETRTMEQSTFDWGVPISVSDPTATRTTTASRDDATQAQRMDGGTITMSPAELEEQRLRQGGAVAIPVIPEGSEEANATTRADTAVSTSQRTGIASADDVRTDGQVKLEGSQQPQIDNAVVDGNAVPATSRSSTTSDTETNATDLASAQGVGNAADSSKTEQEGRIEEGSPVVPEMDPAERAFVLSNELAELKQLRAAEKNRARKDSLDARIGAVEEELRKGQPIVEGSNVENRPPVAERPSTEVIPASEGGIAEEGSEEDATPPQSTERIAAPEEPTRTALEFPANIAGADLVERLFADYTSDKQRITTSTIDARDRSTGLHGLELMLVDSIEAENTRQLALLETHPEQATTILGRSDRLRILKDEHLREAERALSEGQQEYAAGESRIAEDAVIAGSTKPTEATNDWPFTSSATPHNDAYIQVNTDPEAIYSSPIDLRSNEALSELRELNKNGNRMADLEDRIDSLEMVIEAMPPGKARDKQRDRTDKLIDDHMILRTEIGQSMGYYTNAEYKHAKDSADVLRTAVGRLGLAPDEPLMQMLSTTERGAEDDIREAKRLRERADRSEDIVQRDSLYRQAYAAELEALRGMDRSLTLQNHLLSAGFVRGERITYETVEERMFGELEGSPLARVEPERSDAGSDNGAGKDPQGNARYGEFFGADTADKPIGNIPVEDASILEGIAQRAKQRARDLEEQSIAMADRANALQDSASNAKRADRERLTREATRMRSVSDSLHAASLREEAIARTNEEEAMRAAEAAAFKERLLKYYYLSDEDQVVILNEEDMSRYFEARAKALAQREEAAVAEVAAANTKRLANALLEESKVLLANQGPGGTPLTPEQMGQAGQLTDQAVRMLARADSLQRVSERLELAARSNEAQAAVLLQAKEPERATEIMALEQAKRRVEPTLAEARSMTTTGSVEPVRIPGGSGTPPEQADPPLDTTSSTADPITRSTTVPVNASGVSGADTTTSAADLARNEPTTTSERIEPVPSAPVSAPALPTGPVPTPAPGGAPALLEPLTEDIFSFAARDAQRTGPIPIDAPMPAGVVFKVQIGAFKQPISDELFMDLGPVSGETVGNGLVRYSAGQFVSAQSAARATEQVRDRGYRDAFVVAYQDGKRVTLAQAMRAASPVGSTAQRDPAPAASTPVAIVKPVPPPTTPIVLSDSAAAVEQALLANYPATAEQVLAQFAPPADATAYYDVPGAAPARQVETVKGLFYTVQVGVYSKPTALDKLFNIDPLNSERTETNKIRYTTGMFTDMDRVRARKDQTVGLGVKDAFITAYLNGKRIPMRDARALVARFGASVFVDPTLITR